MDGLTKWRDEIRGPIMHVLRVNRHVSYRAVALALITWALEILDEDEQLEAIADAYGIWRGGGKPRLPGDHDYAGSDPPDGWPPIE